jgi:predicted glycosyltransferase
MTAKPQSQTLALATARGLEVEEVGSGELRGLVRKVVGGLERSVRLARWARRHGRPRMVISSSRTAGLAAWFMGVPGVGVMDYEHSEHRALALASSSLWLPDLLKSVRLPWLTARVARFFVGLKENLYLDSWVLDRESDRRKLGLSSGEYLVVARPPAETAHYASELSGRLWLGVMRALTRRPEVRIVVVPRNPGQQDSLRPALQGDDRVRVLTETVEGPALVGAADLVLGGGGTMNREAAVLGIPVWSVFTGPTPHVDACLHAEGRLRWIRSEPEMAEALGSPLPGRQSRRGPFPEGLAAILADIRFRLIRHEEPAR